MRMTGVLAGLVLFGATAGALAQEPPATEPTAKPADQQEEARTACPGQPCASGEPVKKIKVLEDPYDIASFYRSRQTQGGFLGYEDAPLGNVARDPYAIAGYYRSRQRSGGYGYSQFWVSGYNGSYGSTRGRRSMYRRRIGANGDLFLIAPTILAPLGPLTGVFDLDR